MLSVTLTLRPSRLAQSVDPVAGGRCEPETSCESTARRVAVVEGRDTFQRLGERLVADPRGRRRVGTHRLSAGQDTECDDAEQRGDHTGERRHWTRADQQDRRDEAERADLPEFERPVAGLLGPECEQCRQFPIVEGVEGVVGQEQSLPATVPPQVDLDGLCGVGGQYPGRGVDTGGRGEVCESSTLGVGRGTRPACAGDHYWTGDRGEQKDDEEGGDSEQCRPAGQRRGGDREYDRDHREQHREVAPEGARRPEQSGVEVADLADRRQCAGVGDQTDDPDADQRDGGSGDGADDRLGERGGDASDQCTAGLAATDDPQQAERAETDREQPHEEESSEPANRVVGAGEESTGEPERRTGDDREDGGGEQDGEDGDRGEGHTGVGHARQETVSVGCRPGGAGSQPVRTGKHCYRLCRRSSGMDTEQFAAIQGIEMDEEAAEELLRREGVGVLSLADDSLAYCVPVSFGYADRSIYFVFLQPSEDSEKIAFADATREASFLAFIRPSRHNWQSVIARGPIHRLDEGEWDELVEAMADNAWFPSLFAETEPMQDLLGYELRVDSLTGMQSRAAEHSA